MRRRAGLLAALVLASSPAWAAGRKAKPRREPARGAVVASLVDFEGEPVEVDGALARPGREIREGSRVAVARDSRAWLRYRDEGGLLLTGPATLDFARKERAVSLRLGRLLSALPGLRGRFTVRSRGAVAAVRGTDFFVEDVSPGETYVCACEGAIEVTAPGVRGFRTALKGSHHSAQRFLRRAGRLLQSEAGMEHHTDEDIVSIKEKSRRP